MMMEKEYKCTIKIDENKLDDLITKTAEQRIHGIVSNYVHDYLHDNKRISDEVEKQIKESLEHSQDLADEYIRNYLEKLVCENIGDGLNRLKEETLNLNDYMEFERKLSKNSDFMAGVTCAFVFLENLMNGMNMNEYIEDKIAEYAGKSIAFDFKYNQSRINKLAKVIVKEQIKNIPISQENKE